MSNTVELMASAVNAHRAGQLTQAEAAYREVLINHPDHPDALHNIGVLIMQAGKPEAALPYLTRAREVAPTTGQYWLSLAACLMKMQRMQDVIAVLEAAVRSGLRHPDADAMLQQAKIQLVASQAHHEYSPAIAVAIALREEGRFTEMATTLINYLALHADDAVALSVLAQAYLLLQEPQAAATAIEQALVLAPENGIVCRNLARVRLRQQRNDEAQMAASLAYQCNTYDAENRLLMASIYLTKNNLSQALAYTNAALESKPIYAQAFAQRAAILIRLQQVQAAFENIKKATELAPWFAQYWRLLSNISIQLGDRINAINALMQYCKLEPADGLALADTGELLRQENRLAEALTVLEQAVAATPGSATVWTNYGTALQQEKRYADALQCYEKALGINPSQGEIYSNLGAIHKQEGDWDKALLAFEQASQYLPDRIDIRAYKGLALIILKRFNEAGQVLQQALTREADLFSEKHAEITQPDTVIEEPFSYHSQEWIQQALAGSSKSYETLNAIGLLMNDTGRLNEAAAIFEKALPLNPTSPEIHYNLGSALVILNRMDEAAIQYRKMVSFERHNLDWAIWLTVMAYTKNDLPQAQMWIEHARPALTLKELRQKNARAYVIFFDLLFSYWEHQDTASLQTASDEDMLYVIGDSHILATHNVLVRFNDRQVRCHGQLIMGCKQWHLGNVDNNIFKCRFKLLLESTPQQSTILLSIGEIDCRHNEGIIIAWRKSKTKTLEEIITQTITNYLDYVTATANIRHQKLIIAGVPACNLMLDELQIEQAEQFTSLIKLFNQRLKQIAVNDYGLDFLDLFAMTDNGYGKSNKKWHIDDHHLHPNAVAQAFGQHYVRARE